MPSAVLFLPCHIIELTNFVTRSDPYTGSTSTFRLAMYPFRGISASCSWLLASSFELPGDKSLLALNFSCPRPTTNGPRPPLCFRPLGPVLRTALLAAGDADGVQRAPDYVIANTGEILHPAAASQHDGVLLQIVAHAGNVGRNLNPIGQSDAGNFAQGGVRLLGRLRVDASTHTPLLRTSLQGGARRLVPRPLAAATYQLIESRHA